MPITRQLSLGNLTLLSLVVLASTAFSQPPGGPIPPSAVLREDFLLTGAVNRTSDGSPVPGARVTVFLPDLSFFVETRTTSTGSYAIRISERNEYLIGVAKPGFDYVEASITVARPFNERSFMLGPESHPGSWDVIGDTLPEFLDATDIACLQPDGTIFYCHDTTDSIVFDPVTGQKSFPPNSGSEQGCMNATHLRDGSLLIAGGQFGPDFRNATELVKRFNPNDTWDILDPLLAPTGRWYPGLARLNDGRVLIMGGGTRPQAARTDTCEIFDPNTESWSFTGSMNSAVEFPPAALLYNGKVLRTWGTRPQLYDPSTELWTDTGTFNFPNRGYPGHSDHRLIVLTDGRAVAIGASRLNQPGASMTEFYDPDSETWSVGSSPDLIRMQAEAVYLPDGRILVAAGDQEITSGDEPNVLGIVKRCDLFSPVDQSWRRVADLNEFREYHTATVLLRDGRVATTGGTYIKFQVGPTSADIEAYSPPYLFRGVRPVLSNLSDSSPSRNQSLTIDVSPATRLTRIVLMGLPTTTHWVDGGIPRRLELSVTQTGQVAQVRLPADPDELPLGWYLLFGMVDDIPSKALILRVDG